VPETLPHGTDPEGSLTVEQVSESPPEAHDPDAALTVEQVSEDPPDVGMCAPTSTPSGPSGLGSSAIDPDAAERRARVPIIPLLDPTQGALDLPRSPPSPKKRRALDPRALALFGGIFGLAAIVSILAVLIQVDPSARPAFSAAPSSSRAPTAPATNTTTQALAPPTATITAPPAAAKLDPTEPPLPTDPGPWRVSQLANDDSVKMVQGKLGTRSLMDALGEEHVAEQQAFRILKSFDDPKVFDKPKKSHQYVVAIDRATKRVRAFEYIATPTDVWQAKENEEGHLAGIKLDMKVEDRRVAKAVVVKDDLKAAVVEAGFDDDILDTLDDALEDRIALSRIGPGTTLRIIADEQTVFGKFARYTDIEAVELYPPKAEKPTRIYHYRAGKNSGFYDAQGKAPFKGGWRSPVKFPRITSRFNPKRMHPVLHTIMPHNGTDFGATLGTPVFAASYGSVEWVGPKGPNGNLVMLQHAGGIETGYAHLSKFAPGLKLGDKVETRQLIGFVGSTGRSTGPHLHFSVKKNGVFVDALTTLKMDGERVLPKSERDSFDAYRAEMDKIFETLPLPERAPATEAPKDDDDKDEVNEDDAPAASATAVPGTPPPAGTTPPPDDKAKPAAPTTDESESPVWKPL
jgi:murein DD-endopeptidase MepM/ murein hydrolase activator NlpD